MLRYVQKPTSNMMYYVEGTAGNIMLPSVRETPVNIKMHYVLEIMGNMICPMFHKL